MSAWEKLRTAPWFRRSVRTFGIAFLGLAIPGALGWLNDLTAWSSSHGQTPFPDAHSLAYLGTSAITAGVIAVLNALVVKGEDVTGHAFLRTVAPKDNGEGGHATAGGVLRIIAFLLAALILGMIIASIANGVDPHA